VALLYHHDEYGLGLRDGVAAELARRGVAIVDERFFAPEGTPSGARRVERLLAAALLARPDAIVLGARVAETRLVAASLRRQGRSLPVVAGDGSYVLPPSRQGRDLTDLEGVHIVRFWGADRDSASASFARRFEERYGYPPEQSEAFTYDAVMLVGAAARAGARTSEEFRRFFRGLGADQMVYSGIGGRYLFDRGRPRFPVMEMTTVRRGEMLAHPATAAAP
jgi:ABC-type branched-subunit amino acid transport system substrate-binding protein